MVHIVQVSDSGPLWPSCFELMLYVPVYYFSVMLRQTLDGTSTKWSIKCLAQGHITVPLRGEQCLSGRVLDLRSKGH